MAAFERIPFSTEQEWLATRRRIGIGASEVAAAMGVNKYQSTAALFYDKLGLLPPKEDNMAMFMGRYDERHIADLWQYWDGSNESIIVNYKAKNKIREARRFNAIMQSKEYPWLFATPDFLFKMQQYGKCILETKEISKEAAYVWETGIPIMYVYQVMALLLVTGFTYAELCMRVGLRDFQVFPFEPDAQVFNIIVERTQILWQNVLTAREILDNGGSENDIQHLVPPPDGTEAYEAFIKEKYRDGENSEKFIIARPEHYQQASTYLRAEAVYKNAELEFKRIKQELRLEIDKFDGIDFGTEVGKFTYTYDKNGTRSFNKRFKAIAEEEIHSRAAHQRTTDTGGDGGHASMEGL